MIKRAQKAHDPLFLRDLPGKDDPGHSILWLFAAALKDLAVIAHSYPAKLLRIRLIDLQHFVALGLLGHKDPVQLPDLSGDISPLKICLLHLPDIRIVAEPVDPAVREMFPHQRGEKIEMVAEDQIRVKGFHRLRYLLKKRLAKRFCHFFRHITVPGAGIGHLIRHPRDGIGKGFRLKIHRVKSHFRRQADLVFPVDSCHHRLGVALSGEFLHQLRKIDPASCAGWFLCCYA